MFKLSIQGLRRETASQQFTWYFSMPTTTNQQRNETFCRHNMILTFVSPAIPQCHRLKRTMNVVLVDHMSERANLVSKSCCPVKKVRAMHASSQPTNNKSTNVHGLTPHHCLLRCFTFSFTFASIATSPTFVWSPMRTNLWNNVQSDVAMSCRCSCTCNNQPKLINDWCLQRFICCSNWNLHNSCSKMFNNDSTCVSTNQNRM